MGFPPRAARRRGGFTLVELLAVVGIVGLLVSILIPALSMARQQANAVKCLSNLRQLGLGITLYLTDNRQTYPQPFQDSNIPSPTAAGQALWFNAVDPYLARNIKAYSSNDADARNYTDLKQDPVYPTLGEDLNTPNAQRSRTYKMNASFGNLGTGVRWTRAARLRRSSDTVLLFDGVSRDCATLPASNSAAFDFFGDEITVGLRHRRFRSANVLLADGHAAAWLQPAQHYTSASGKSDYRTWYFEYLGAAAGTPAPAGAARNPNQQLVWDIQR